MTEDAGLKSKGSNSFHVTVQWTLPAVKMSGCKVAFITSSHSLVRRFLTNIRLSRSPGRHLHSEPGQLLLLFRYDLSLIYYYFVHLKVYF
jgi:hypothetical protein